LPRGIRASVGRVFYSNKQLNFIFLEEIVINRCKAGAAWELFLLLTDQHPTLKLLEREGALLHKSTPATAWQDSGMTKPAPKRYRTTNWNTYDQALIQRGSLSVWLDTGMSWQATPRGKRGRTQTYSDMAIQFCLTIKNLFGLPLRQTIGFIQSLLKLAGLDWSVPDYSTLSRRQQTLQVQIPYQKSAGALHLLVDSTGIKGEWKTKKHGAEYRRQWRKVHLGIDAETLQIRAIEVTVNRQGDAQMLSSLLAQIPVDEPIGCVSGDGAFDTKTCHEAIAARGAIGCIPTHKNAKLLQHAGPSLYGGYGVNLFGERGASPCSGLMQQRPLQPACAARAKGYRAQESEQARGAHASWPWDRQLTAAVAPASCNPACDWSHLVAAT
jgi:hypothetical protein